MVLGEGRRRCSWAWGAWCQKHPEAERECGSGWHNGTLAVAENEQEVGIRRMAGALGAGKEILGVMGSGRCGGGLFLRSTDPLCPSPSSIFWLPGCVASSLPELLKGFGAARQEKLLMSL